MFIYPDSCRFRRMRSLAVVLLASALSFLGTETCLISAAEIGDALAQEIADHYLDARDSFRALPVYCRFTVTTGIASTVDDALNGTLKDAIVANVEWLMDGDLAKFVLSAETSTLAEVLERRKIANLSTLPISPEAFLRSDRMGLRYSPVLGIATVTASVEKFPQPDLTPESMGVMGENGEHNPGDIIKSWIHRQLPLSCKSETGAEGTSLVEVKLGRAPAALTLGYRFDASDYFALREHWDTDPDTNERTFVLLVTSTLHPVEGVSLPGKSVFIDQPDSKSSHFVRIIEVDEITIRELRENEFSLMLPANTRVNNGQDVNSTYKLSTDMNVGVDDLPLILENCEEAIASKSIQHNGEDSRQQGGMFLIAINILVIAALAAGIFWYRFQSR